MYACREGRIHALPRDKPAYQLQYSAVEDRGALPPHVLRSRRSRENSSLLSFQRGPLVQMARLAQLHEWLNLRHAGYNVQGMLSKKPLDRSSALAQTY